MMAREAQNPRDNLIPIQDVWAADALPIRQLNHNTMNEVSLRPARIIWSGIRLEESR
jgi:hypothetical protein